MKTVVPALAGLLLTVSTLAPAAEAPRPPAKAQTAKKKAPAKPSAKAPAKAKALSARDQAPPSPEAARVVTWVAASKDNYGLPYAIIDKKAAALMLFDGRGKPLGRVPVLIGIAVGDDATPGVGSKNLAEIGPAEKTTPAGRFLAKFGLAAGRQKVLWVDYATSVALHPIPTANKKERRRERMLSPTIDDNRITFGCINVPKAFYANTLSPLFRKKGGYVYVLPDTKPLETVFPPLRVAALAGG